MRKLLFILGIVMCSLSVSAQTTNPFPTTDSLRKFINKWIRNSAVDAFTNLRLNTALIGMSRFIDSVDGSTGVKYSDTAAMLAGYLRKGDTASMLAGYTRVTRFIDSVAALRAAINTKASLSALVDTAAAIRAASGTGNVTKAYVDSLDGYWKERIVGRLWRDQFTRGSLGGNYSETTPNTDVALNGAKMTFKSGTNNSFTDWVEYTNQYFNWNRGRIDIKFQIDSLGNGFALGWNTQAAGSLNNNFQCRFLVFTNGTDTAGRLDFMSNGTAIKTGSTQFNYSKNDTLSMSVYRYDNTFIFTVRNLSRNGLNSEVTETYTFPLSIGSYTYSPPNVSRLRLFSLGGNQSFYEFSAYSYASLYPQVLFIGDSESIGIGTTANRNGFPFRVMYGLDQFVVHAGGFERSADALLRIPDVVSVKPKYVVIVLGVNDGGAGVSQATFESNIDQQVVAYQAQGCIVILATMIPTSNNNTTEANYNTAINNIATNRGCQVVQVYNSGLNDGSGGLAAAYDGGDDIHLSDAGAQYMGALFHPVVPLDSSYTNAVHFRKLDTLTTGTFNFVTAEKYSGKAGSLDVSSLGLQAVTTFGNTTTNAVKIQEDTYTTTTNQLSVGAQRYFSTDNANSFRTHNANLVSGAFRRIVASGGVVEQEGNAFKLFNIFTTGSAGSSISSFIGAGRLDANGFWIGQGLTAANGSTTGAQHQFMTNGHVVMGMGADNSFLNLNHTSFNLFDLNTSFSTGGYISFRQGNTLRSYLGIGSATTIGAALGDLSVRSDTVHISDGSGAKMATFAGGEFRIGTPAIDRGAYTIQNTGGFYQNGSAYLAGQNTGTNTMKLLVKGTDSLVYQIDPSSLSSTPALTTNYIGYGVSSLLSGSSSYQYNGTNVTQANSAARNYIVNTDALGSTSGGSVSLYNDGTPSTSSQSLGNLEFGARISGNYRLGASIRALSSGAWTDGSVYRTDLIFSVTASGSATPSVGMRLNGGSRLYVGGNTVASATLHLAAGSAGASGAPLKFTSGTNQTTAEAGALEYDGTYFTATPGDAVRRNVVLMDAATPNTGDILMRSGNYWTRATYSTVSTQNTTGSLPAGQFTMVQIIKTSPGASNITITISGSFAGQKYIIKKMDNGVGVVTVNASSGTFDGAASVNITGQYETISAIWDGTNWLLLP